jgi:hypothetical protein
MSLIINLPVVKELYNMYEVKVMNINSWKNHISKAIKVHRRQKPELETYISSVIIVSYPRKPEGMQNAKYIYI